MMSFVKSTRHILIIYLYDGAELNGELDYGVNLECHRKPDGFVGSGYNLPDCTPWNGIEGFIYA